MHVRRISDFWFERLRAAQARWRRGPGDPSGRGFTHETRPVAADEVAEETLDALKLYLNDCQYCMICKRVRSSIRAHRSKTKKKGFSHETRKMQPDERVVEGKQ